MKHGRLDLIKTCVRSGCGREFHPWRKAQGHCSRSCARKDSPKFLAHIRRAGRIGGLKGGAIRRRAAVQRWNEQIVGMTKVQIAKAFYKKGYNNGRAANARITFARGYQQAIDDMREKAAA